ncbi:uncharacterized protein Dwil_GK22782, isoform A [Drosophila willistoni]|uniref:Transcriptional adapter n=1 Tax=Drosophila willistoni TaxID=7260 RepID=B4NG88_DROWI|nr:transcriptional adapter 2A isoform X1 [Drosophila willistoni]EDW83305.1 uncharacterized protein Dwil_GK22782, isoform A [Drosophila willistoni]
MSFMNPVDMVDEDAADLQFPKVKLKADQLEIIRPDVQTKKMEIFYNPLALNRQLEDLHQKLNTEQEPRLETSKSCEDDASTKCSGCRCSLSEPFIKCAECLDIYLCLQCFARGRELATHRNNHSYIIQRDDIQIFPDQPQWLANDERLLLQSLSSHGYANWEAISQSLGMRYKPEEVQRHYHDCYFGGIFERLLGLSHSRHSYLPERMPYVVKMKSVEPPRHDDISSMLFKLNAGYRFARGDFDTPYDTSAESLLTIMMEQPQHNDEDEEEQSVLEHDLNEELKFALVRAYNNRLRERQRRYSVMRDHGLIMPNRTVSWISKYVGAFPNDTSCMRFLSFMQICEPTEFDKLVESLSYCHDLHTRLHRLYELRQHGIRTLSGGVLYKRLLRKRQQMLKDYARQRQTTAQDWQQLVQHYENNQGSEHLPLASSSKIYVLNTRRKASPIEVEDLPGFAKLSPDERQLCSVARLVPQAYLDYKTQLIAEQAKLGGHLRLADARKLIKIDVNKTRQIYDFLVENGHLSRPQTYG